MALFPADNKEFTVETRYVSPAHLLFRIESFSLLMENKIQQIESTEFAAGDYKWRLMICLNKDKSENADDHISVYLSAADTSSLPMDWEVNAIFSVFLYNQILDNYLCFRGNLWRFHAMYSKRGFSKLITKKFLRTPSNGYLVDDNCVFGAEVYVIKSQRVTESVSLLKVANTHKYTWTITHFSKLKDVWTSDEFTIQYYRWKILLYPNGNGTGKGSSVSIYLECVDANSFVTNQKVKADYCLRIKNKLNDSHYSRNLSCWFKSSEKNWGLPEFLSLADMRDPKKGFVVDDCCVLEADIFVDVDAFKQ